MVVRRQRVKYSQQISHSRDHGSSYADRERKTLQVSLHISQMVNVSTFGNTADTYATVYLVPHVCQHITVDQSHSSGDTVAKIWRLAGSGGTKTVSFTNRQKKKSHGVKSRDRGGHRINVSSSFLVRPIHLCGKFRLRYPRMFCSEPESRGVERCNHYCLQSTVTSAWFPSRWPRIETGGGRLWVR